MARPFKYPSVTALQPGEFCTVATDESFNKFVKRCLAHADRAGKEFTFIELHDGEGYQVARVPAQPFKE